VLKRVRDLKVVALVTEVIEPINPASPQAESLAPDESRLTKSDYEDALLLRDIYKKANFGVMRARTVVSIQDLLAAAQDFEEGGLLLYRHAAHLGEMHKATYQPMEQFHEERLLRLVKLEDQLRYHRVRLV
jgi:hypothetical protein